MSTDNPAYLQQCPRENKHCGFLRGQGCSLEAVCMEVASLRAILDAMKAANRDSSR